MKAFGTYYLHIYKRAKIKILNDLLEYLVQRLHLSYFKYILMKNRTKKTYRDCNTESENLYINKRSTIFVEKCFSILKYIYVIQIFFSIQILKFNKIIFMLFWHNFETI